MGKLKSLIEKTATSFGDSDILSIYKHRFKNCTSLSFVNFPNCSYIGSNAFADCTALKSISFPNCTYIGSYAFYRCLSLTSIDFPNCSYIEGNAFTKCNLLSSINLPNCSYINDDAFAYCSSLTAISLPKCTSLYGAFKNCSSLSTAYFTGSQFCTMLTSYAFYNTQITSNTGSIYVNHNLVENYKSASEWSYFKSVIYADFIPSACTSLSITADDVNGRATTTTIHYSAVCTGTYLDGTPGTETLKGDAVSEPFPQNPSTTETVQRTISYTFMGVTASTTITQGVWSPADGLSWETAYDVSSIGTYTADVHSTCTPSPYRNRYACWYKFTAPSTGTYYFAGDATAGNGDTYGELWSASSTPTSSNRLTYDDDSGGSSQFRMSYSCTADQSYYVAVEYYSSREGNIVWKIYQ